MLAAYQPTRAPRPRMAFATRIHTHPVVLVRHEAAGKAPSWFFLQVMQAKLQAFRRAMAEGELELTEYGTVLASGFGVSPPTRTMKRMQTLYGFKGE